MSVTGRRCNSRKGALWPQQFADRLRLLSAPVTEAFLTRLELERERSHPAT